MKRRTFIQLSAVGGLAWPGLTISACSEATSQKKGTDFPSYPYPELEEITISAIQQAFSEGRLDCRTLVGQYLARIESIDPLLHSVIELNPDALAIAETLDRERSAGQVRGPLHGIPVLIKDNIDTADRMMTTAGALALLGNVAREDSWVAARLRAAGAIILGKTNLSEWANFRSTRSSSGWSSRGGQTNNPYATGRNTSGSSSGSGAAVSANLCAVAIGTETNGSIISPASVCGVVGIKPTVGLVGRSGIIPISHTQDTAGPMARTVRDAAILLGALTGVDPRDAATVESRGQSYTDYTPFLDENGLQGARIGIDRSAFGFHEGVSREMETALSMMREKGATLIDLERVVHAAIDNEEFQVLLYEFKHGLNAYLAERRDPVEVRSLADVIAFNQAHAAENLPYFGQEILIQAEQKGGLDSPEYREALAKLRTATREQGIDRVMSEHRLDAILAPAEGPAWATDLVNGDRYISGGIGYGFPAIAGYPSISIPAGYVHDLPVGLCLYGKAWSEPVLLKLAYAYENVSRRRSAPQFK